MTKVQEQLTDIGRKYAQALDHISEAMKLYDEAGKMQGLIGVGLITHHEKLKGAYNDAIERIVSVTRALEEANRG